jgi:hypothetical protein
MRITTTNEENLSMLLLLLVPFIIFWSLYIISRDDQVIHDTLKIECERYGDLPKDEIIWKCLHFYE